MRVGRVVPTPVGDLFVSVHDDTVTSIRFEQWGRFPALLGAHPVLDACEAWLDAWLGGHEAPRSFPFRADGTVFQQLVWAAVQGIPMGQTRNYAEVAEAVGRPGGAQAVGAANAANPLLILVPCHRVVGSDGALTGYADGLERKRWLLGHEGALGQGSLFD